MLANPPPPNVPEAGSVSPCDASKAEKPVGSRLPLLAIDPRSLALFRILIALLLLVDLAIRAGDLQTMYTDDGMFPRYEMLRLMPSLWNWSLHNLGGSWQFQAVLFAIAALLAMALLLGWQSRIAVIGSWLLLVSIQHRVPPVISGAEILLRMLLFWAMFLPLARRWSLDARRKGHQHPGHSAENVPVLSAGSAAILLQMALMYLFTAIFKSNQHWLEGGVLAGVLQHDFYASAAGMHLLPFPRLLHALTIATLVLEWAAPFLLIFARSTWLRLTTVGSLVLMHAGMGICLEVGQFPWVAIAGLTLFLPTGMWDRKCRPPQISGASLPSWRTILQAPGQRLCLALLGGVIIINLNTLPARPLRFLAPEHWSPLTRGLGFSQRWGMFEEVPSMDGWYLAGAKLQNGSQVDLLRHGAALSAERPAFPPGIYPNHYWKKLFREMAYTDEQGFQHFRPSVCRFLCRRWNAANPPDKQIAGFDLVFCEQNPDPAGPPVRALQLLHLGAGEF